MGSAKQHVQPCHVCSRSGPDGMLCFAQDAHQLFEALSKVLVDHKVIKGARPILQGAHKSSGNKQRRSWA